MHVIIIGGGITGLLIAQGCKKNNIPFTVYEKEPSAKDYSNRLREWGLSFHWAIPQFEKCVPKDLASRLQETQANPYKPMEAHEYIDFYNATSTSGEVIYKIPVQSLRRVSRNKLRGLLTEGLDIKYGKRLKSMIYTDESNVTVTFDDETTASGSLVVGCDGPKSKVREAIFGIEKGSAKPVGQRLSNLVVNYRDVEKANHLKNSHEGPMCMGTHEKGYYTFFGVVDIEKPDDGLTWQFQVINSQYSSANATGNALVKPIESLTMLKERAKEFCEPFKSAIEWIPDDTKYFESEITQWMPVEFDMMDGRVTLAGDAAHPMAPNRGQGLNHAVCDAANFVEALVSISNGDKTRYEAIAEYTAEMIKRGADEVVLSELNGGMVHDLHRFADSPFVKKNLSRQGHGSELVEEK